MDAARVDYTRPAHAERCAQTLHVRTVTRQSNVDLALSLVSASARAGLHVDANLVDGGASAPTMHQLRALEKSESCAVVYARACGAGPRRITWCEHAAEAGNITGRTSLGRARRIETVKAAGP